jgi:phospholipid-binding lipoprotein MlaA
MEDERPRRRAAVPGDTMPDKQEKQRRFSGQDPLLGIFLAAALVATGFFPAAAQSAEAQALVSETNSMVNAVAAPKPEEQEGAASPVAANTAPEEVPPGLGGGPYTDPLAPFNERMFWFNLKLDDYIVHPLASGYAKVVPVGARESVGRFFDNVDFIPRFANSLFQLRMAQASIELARFGINTTLGVGGLFDVANGWFGLKEADNDFGLTMGHYGLGTGAYLVLPFVGPTDIRDAAGRVADGAMFPLGYFVPWYIYIPAEAGQSFAEGVNYRSLHLNLFEEVDRYAIDLYGAVQDGYLQRRAAQVREVNAKSPL